MTKFLNCDSRSDEEVGKKLSNLARRPFILDGVPCASMEGFLQSLKAADPQAQRYLRSDSGHSAWKNGQAHTAEWQPRQTLFWLGVEYQRESPEYSDLLNEAYDAQYEQLKPWLIKSIGRQLRHPRGSNDPRKTVLTEAEYIGQLERLRWRAIEELERESVVGDPSPDGQEQR